MFSGKKSISSQYHGRLSFGAANITPRNTEIISAALQSRSEPETTRKREELKKQIEEARRKLQSVSEQSFEISIGSEMFRWLPIDGAWCSILSKYSTSIHFSTLFSKSKASTSQKWNTILDR